MKKILTLLLPLLLFACKEKDLTIDNPDLPDENLRLSSSYLYGDEVLVRDSLYQNNLGQKFYIDDVKFLVSGFFMINGGDTIKKENRKYFTYSLDKQGYLITKLPKGGYSGHYGLTLGLDSMASAEVKPEATGENSGLRDQDIIRNDGFGYNALVIKGRVLDPLLPLDSVGKPFRYEIGGYALNRTLVSDQLHFSVVNNMEAKFFIVLNLEPVLEEFNILKRLNVVTDYQNAVDFGLAKGMLDSLHINLF